MDLKETYSLIYQNARYSLEIGEKAALVYTPAGAAQAIALDWPQFEIDGVPSGKPDALAMIGSEQLTDTIQEYVCEGSLPSGARLTMTLRLCDQSPVIRFRYALSAARPSRLTKTNGENLTYFAYSGAPDAHRTEVRLSNYNSLSHSYCPNELPAFAYEDEIMGPILVEQRGNICMLAAYEHGSQYPDKYLAFVRTQDGVALKAVKGNYWNGESIEGAPYETVWLQFAAILGDEDALSLAYRTFQLKYCTLNQESRKPYIFYNTWGFCERNKFLAGEPYFAHMNQKHMEEEIDRAHQIGIDVFVMDVGWYLKTGDWEAHPERFPEGLAPIRRKLDAYGMKLGLWFNPTMAGQTSKMLAAHPNARMKRKGAQIKPRTVWESEASYPMCLASDYWEAFADKLIELAGTLGVRYFKWDAVDMRGCDCGCHNHGGPDTDARESADCYAFSVGPYLSKIADKVCKAYPDAIVDMDVTEGERSVGLGFLSSGKYFTVNNGPYYPNYDIPLAEGQWSNIFVYPGPARTWICRQSLDYDKWIPSVLTLAHYMPNDPIGSQRVNLASLILGQNGIWGDLLAVSEEGVAWMSRVLDAYKRLRDDITEARDVTFGKPGEVFEAHEKINPANGRGAVVIFANSRGHYPYRLQTNAAGAPVIFGDARFVEENGERRVECDFERADAAILYFGL